MDDFRPEGECEQSAVVPLSVGSLCPMCSLFCGLPISLSLSLSSNETGNGNFVAEYIRSLRQPSLYSLYSLLAGMSIALNWLSLSYTYCIYIYIYIHTVYTYIYIYGIYVCMYVCTHNVYKNLYIYPPFSLAFCWGGGGGHNVPYTDLETVRGNKMNIFRANPIVLHSFHCI